MQSQCVSNKPQHNYIIKLEINMYHLRGAMQYRQAPLAIFLATFTTLGVGECVPGPASCQTSRSLQNVGLQAST